MRHYAEQTWGAWDGRADFDLATDKIIQCGGTDIGLFGAELHAGQLWLEKLYLLPAYQNRGIGALLVEGMKAEARAAGVSIQLTVLDVNPARRFYERQGFVLAETVMPRHRMEWRAPEAG